MKICKIARFILAVSLGSVVNIIPAYAQENPAAAKASPTPAAKLSEAEMMAQWMALAKPGEPHRLLTQLVGPWTYTLKIETAPGTPLVDAGHGVAVRTSLMDGRYVRMDVTGKTIMPGADGGTKETDFQGMSLEGYDNVKQKFVSSWIDNMGTSIVPSEGTYDPATKSFTYSFEMEPAPGMKVKAHQVVTMIDADHYRMDWYEDHGGSANKTLEISYTRQK